MFDSKVMVYFKSGDTVRIRDRNKGQETSNRVLAASEELILTSDRQRFIERFGADGWNMAHTKCIVARTE